MTDASIQMRVVFSGHVQGVGFRQTAIHIARAFPVTGWVRNLPSGDVELVAEGSQTACGDFLAEIRQRMFEYISDVQCQWQDASHEFEHFEIRY